MEKCWSVFILFILTLHVAKAQAYSEPEFKRFGFRAGVNSSHMNFAKGVPPPPVPIETSWHTGINLGFVMVVPIAENLYFQPEYAYSQMGGEVKSSDTAYHLNYLSMPLFLKYQLFEKFSVMAGPQFDLLIDSKRTVGGKSATITHDTEERSLSAVIGIEYDLIESLSVGARYVYGINHIGLGQRSDIQEFKYEMVQVMACFKF
jgi:hypothetical protein